APGGAVGARPAAVEEGALPGRPRRRALPGPHHRRPAVRAVRAARGLPRGRPGADSHARRRLLPVRARGAPPAGRAPGKGLPARRRGGGRPDRRGPAPSRPRPAHRRHAGAAAARRVVSLTPTVAIVGRPNVGKSTLFNRLLGRRQAIVHDLPGVTRDRITGVGVLDDDRPVQLVDTGGLVPGNDPLGLNQQVLLAVQESDLLLFVVDGKQGLVAADEEVWGEVRRAGNPAILVVNKGDTSEARGRFPEFYQLGIDPQLLVSAEHGGGVRDLWEAMGAALPAAPAEPRPEA